MLFLLIYKIGVLYKIYVFVYIINFWVKNSIFCLNGLGVDRFNVIYFFCFLVGLFLNYFRYYGLRLF